MKINLLIFVAITASLFFPVSGHTATTKTITVDEHPIHIATWGTQNDAEKPWVVLLSGPIDSWHSDIAWFAALGPALASDYRVLAIDRASLVNETDNPPVGYAHFAHDLKLVLKQQDVNNATLVAFASSNISTQIYLARHPQQTAIKRVVLIDPDVLTEFSIARYSNDAEPFKLNLDKYLEYIEQGKYTERVKQKNQHDLATLQALNDDKQIDWPFVEKMMDKRLLVVNQLNLFREIARYDEDLQAANQHQWPKQIPTIVIDTQFEQHYIDASEEQSNTQGLIQWQQDATQYYQMLSRLNPHSQYLASDSQAHLIQFEQPKWLKLVIDQLIEDTQG